MSRLLLKLSRVVKIYLSCLALRSACSYPFIWIFERTRYICFFFCYIRLVYLTKRKNWFFFPKDNLLLNIHWENSTELLALLLHLLLLLPISFFFCSYVYLPIYNLHVIIRSCVVCMFSFLISICMLWWVNCMRMGGTLHKYSYEHIWNTIGDCKGSVLHWYYKIESTTDGGCIVNVYKGKCALFETLERPWTF